MASLFACFKPRKASLSESGVTSLVSKKHSAIAAIITGVSNSACTSADPAIKGGSHISSQIEDHIEEPNCSNVQVLTGGTVCDGLGILIYPSLLLTTHTTIPSPASAHDAEINLRYSNTSLNILRRRFLPELFFATNASLNITVVACEFVNPEMHPLGLDTSKVDAKAFEMGSRVFVLGHDRNKGSPIKLSVGCGYVLTEGNVSLTIRSREEAWLRGSAGFDHKGNFALMITDSGPDNDMELKNSCVTIHSIKSWLEPQWQATRSHTSTTIAPPRTSLLYTRRATYAGPETGPSIDAYVKEFDEKRDHGNGKMTHASSVVVLGDHGKGMASRVANSGTAEVSQSARWNDMSRVGEAGSSGGVSRQVMREEQKPASSNMKGEVGGSKPQGAAGGTGSTWKEVEVTKEPASSSAMRGDHQKGANNTGKKGKVSIAREHVQDMKKGEARANLQNKGGGLSKMQNSSTMESSGRKGGKKPASLHQAFQRDRKSLQLRLHDIPIKDKL